MLISIGLGVLIIFLVARNFSKPLKVKLESPEFSAQSAWTVESWRLDTSYVYVGDTLAVFSAAGQTNALVSIYEGQMASLPLAAGTLVPSGEIVARVKVDIWKIVRDAFRRTNYWWIASRCSSP